LTLTTRAPAKVNLTLHVRGRRADGYHELESLVAFAGTGDSLCLEPGEAVSLSVAGPTAPQAGTDDNLVLTAARALAERRPGLQTGAFRLVKRLPVAAGLGGGSADAAAALRLLARLNDVGLDDPAVVDAARATGADVPVCLKPRACMMGGAGEVLGLPLRLPPLYAVLANPGVPVATAAVFRELALQPGERMPGAPHPTVPPRLEAAELRAVLRASRNDLEPAATKLAPAIGEALALMRELPGCFLARMSGSGATVFGLFENRAASGSAAAAIRARRPNWWAKPTGLR
jgi:4-diphosphocytidyl-2-C-methyl-D-erythritol kinase